MAATPARRPSPLLSPLLTWVGTGPRREAGCRGRWPGLLQTGGRRAAGRAGLPGRLRTGRAGLRHSPGWAGRASVGSVPSLNTLCTTQTVLPAVQCWASHSASLCLSFLTVTRVRHRAWHIGSTQHTVGAVVTVIVTPTGMTSNLSLLWVTENPPPHPADASSTSPVVTTRHIPTHCPVSPGQNRGSWTTPRITLRRPPALELHLVHNTRLVNPAVVPGNHQDPIY